MSHLCIATFGQMGQMYSNIAPIDYKGEHVTCWNIKVDAFLGNLNGFWNYMVFQIYVKEKQVHLNLIVLRLILKSYIS